MDTNSNIAPVSKTVSPSGETNSNVSCVAHHPPGARAGKFKSTNSQDRLLSRTLVELMFKVRKTMNTGLLEQFTRVSLGQDISRYSSSSSFSPLVQTPEDPTIMVKQLAGVRPEPGTAYSAVTLDNGDLVLTEAHSIDPPNSAMEDNFVLPIPSFTEETYQKHTEECFLTYLSIRPNPLISS